MRRVLTDNMSVEMTGHSEACINRQDECRDDRT